MALATYSDLKTAVATWLSRADLTSQIPDFITLCHNKLMRVLRVREMETINSTFTVGAETADVPSDWLETRKIYVTSSSPRRDLQYVSPDKIVEYNADAATGAPRFFTVVGGKFQFIPIPDATYTGTHVYYASLAKMSASSDTNWLLTSHPDLYLYGSLLEATSLIQDDPRIPMWQQMYDRGLMELTRQSQHAKSGPAMQTRPG